MRLLAPPDTRGWLALALVLMLSTATVAAFVTGSKDLANILSAGIKDSFLIAIGFYFGSSKNSSEVRAQLGQALDKVPNAKPAEEGA